LESYIIRIVRRQANPDDDLPALIGVVEDAEGNTRLPFHTAEELWSILGYFTTTNQQPSVPVE